MKNVVFVTGNPEKAANFSKHMGADIPHAPADLDEIQTLDAKKLVEHKIKQAFNQVGKPVLVEDVTFVYEALGELPGPFIKYFVTTENYDEKMCRMADGFMNRRAKAVCTYGFYDGSNLKFFEGEIGGVITQTPRGDNGYGFDRVFEPDGFGGRTAAELDDDEYDQYYSTIKPFHKLKLFLESDE